MKKTESNVHIDLLIDRESKERQETFFVEFWRLHEQDIKEKIIADQNGNIAHLHDVTKKNVTDIQQLVLDREKRFCQHILNKLFSLIKEKQPELGLSLDFTTTTLALSDIDETLGTDIQNTETETKFLEKLDTHSSDPNSSWSLRPSSVYLCQYIQQKNICLGILSTRSENALFKQLNGTETRASLSELNPYISNSHVRGVFRPGLIGLINGQNRDISFVLGVQTTDELSVTTDILNYSDEYDKYKNGDIELTALSEKVENIRMVIMILDAIKTFIPEHLDHLKQLIQANNIKDIIDIISNSLKEDTDEARKRKFKRVLRQIDLAKPHPKYEIERRKIHDVAATCSSIFAYLSNRLSGDFANFAETLFQNDLSTIDNLASLSRTISYEMHKRREENEVRHDEYIKTLATCFSINTSLPTFTDSDDYWRLSILVQRIALARQMCIQDNTSVTLVFDNDMYAEHFENLLEGKLKDDNGEIIDGYTLMGISDVKGKLFITSCGQNGAYDRKEIVREIKSAA